MANILVISGKQQSGKSNITKYLYGYKMLQRGVIKRFNFTENGDLLIPVKNTEGEDGWGLFDIFRQDDEFQNFLYGSGIAGEIERFSFADQLKGSITRVFGIDPKLYLTDEGKQTETHIPWSKFKKFLDPKTIKELKEGGVFERNMTVREVMQYFGTDICRHLDDDCWVRSTWEAVSQSPAKMVVIDDCRFPNEFYYFKSRGAKTVRLKRQVKDSQVKSEVAMDDIPDEEYDLVIHNQDMNMAAKNKLVTEYLVSIGWLTDGVLA